jgi:glycosyl transferase family 2
VSRPLVSVITPTWQRHELLLEAMDSIHRQTYRPLEHVIVSDGPDPALRAAVGAIPWNRRPRLVELGRNWSSALPDSFCAAPMLVGQLVARGAYQTWLADDERMAPDHIEGLVTALEAEGADFAYSRVRLYWVGQTPEQGRDIGTNPPQCGQITNVLYRADLLKRGLYPFGAGMTSDWACISQWINAGATWAYVDRVTLTHRVDH